MAATETTPNSKQAKGIFTTSVGSEVGSLILEDAHTEDRSESCIIRRICEKHYAARLKRLRAGHPITTAIQPLRRAA